MKFDSDDHEYLYRCTLDGVCESSGESEAPTGWFAAVSIPPGEALDKEHSSDLDLTEPPVGHFLLIEDSQGFVYVEKYDTDAALGEAFARRDAEYSRWLGDGEGEQ
jgi:hypothetical protein